MELTYQSLKRISEVVGERSGWDFSRVRDGRDPVPWDYREVVCRFLRPSDHVLDVGTGGGEVFLALASQFGKGAGIDISAEMIGQALRNKRAQRVANIDFAEMDGRHLGFESGAFDVVINRHCDVDVSETARVLRAGGYFITQQVGRRNTTSILAAFGWSADSFGEE
jgi:ubiquinone/menaquinone biosynthesis C-methylase UbiE